MAHVGLALVRPRLRLELSHLLLILLCGRRRRRRRDHLLRHLLGRLCLDDGLLLRLTRRDARLVTHRARVLLLGALAQPRRREVLVVQRDHLLCRGLHVAELLEPPSNGEHDRLRQLLSLRVRQDRLTHRSLEREVGLLLLRPLALGLLVLAALCILGSLDRALCAALLGLPLQEARHLGGELLLVLGGQGGELRQNGVNGDRLGGHLALFSRFLRYASLLRMYWDWRAATNQFFS